MVMGLVVAARRDLVDPAPWRRAEALAWSVLFGLTPFSAVSPGFDPPKAVQPIAFALPSAHVFEGMRGRWPGHRLDHLAWAVD